MEEKTFDLYKNLKKIKKDYPKTYEQDLKSLKNHKNSMFEEAIKGAAGGIIANQYKKINIK